MSTWDNFESDAPDLALFGYERLNDQVAYLATTRRDGSPRVHPVSARIREGHLFLRMSQTSPKAKDLLRDGRYAMHSLVTDTSGSGGEFMIAGIGALVESEDLRALVERRLPGTFDRFIVFELNVHEAMSTLYESGEEIRKKWRKPTTLR